MCLDTHITNLNTSEYKYLNPFTSYSHLIREGKGPGWTPFRGQRTRKGFFS